MTPHPGSDRVSDRPGEAFARRQEADVIKGFKDFLASPEAKAAFQTAGFGVQ